MIIDHDGRIAHLIKLCDDYPYSDCIITDNVISYRNKNTGEITKVDSCDRYLTNDNPICLTLSYSEAVFNDLMVIGIFSGLRHSDYFDNDKARNMRSGIDKGYAFRGWAVNIEYLRGLL